MRLLDYLLITTCASAVVGFLLYISLIDKSAVHLKEQSINKIEQLLDQEFYSPFEDIIYVNSTDDGWEVSTEQHGTLFVEISYNQAISMASVLTWIGYQCDYTCKDEMVEKALYEHYQLMYHE